MINFQPGQVWYPIRLPYTPREQGYKARPVIVIEEVDKNFLKVVVTTSFKDLPNNDAIDSMPDKKSIVDLWDDDIVLKVTKQTGLTTNSAARMASVLILKKTSMVEYRGEIEEDDLKKIIKANNYIESQFFKNPKHFTYWLLRQNIEYAGILDLNNPVRPLYKIKEDLIADSFDIAIASRKICEAANIDNTIGIVIYDTKGGFNTHIFSITSYKGKKSSPVCFYNNSAYFLSTFGSYEHALSKLSKNYSYAISPAPKHHPVRAITRRVLTKDKLDWLDQNCHKKSKVDLLGELMGPWAQSVILDQASLT